MPKTDKKTELKEIDPFLIAVNDSIANGFFDDNNFKMEKLIGICRKRGLVGNWTLESLSHPLEAFEQASREKNDDEIDTLLTAFAAAIDFDANLMKRYYYSIKQNWKAEFLKKESGVELFPKEDNENPSAVEPIGKDL
jgi:hypothetical protein